MAIAHGNGRLAHVCGANDDQLAVEADVVHVSMGFTSFLFTFKVSVVWVLYIFLVSTSFLFRASFLMVFVFFLERFVI